MKICFFSYQMLEYGGGVAKYYTEVAQELRKTTKSSISIITFDEQLLRKILFIYTIYFLGKQDQLQSFKESSKHIHHALKGISYIKVASFSELFRMFKTQDVIYTTNNLLELLLITFFTRTNNKKKIIIGFHIPLIYPMTHSLSTKIHNYLYRSPLYAFLLTSGTIFHTLNSFTTDFLRKKFPQKDIRTILTPLKPSKKTIPLKQIENHHAFTILWVGRLTEQKGITKLIEIIRTVNNKTKKNIHWIIIGDGELRYLLDDLSQAYQNVSVLGYIPNTKLTTYYASADLFIMTSISESYPYTLLEAQQYNLFSVAFNIPGCNDMIQNGKTGYLVSSTNDFSKKILHTIYKMNKPRVHHNVNFEKRWNELESLFSI